MGWGTQLSGKPMPYGVWSPREVVPHRHCDMGRPGARAQMCPLQAQGICCPRGAVTAGFNPGSHEPAQDWGWGMDSSPACLRSYPGP